MTQHTDEYARQMIAVQAILDRIREAIQDVDPDQVDSWDVRKIGGIRRRLERVNNYLDEDIR